MVEADFVLWYLNFMDNHWTLMVQLQLKIYILVVMFTECVVIQSIEPHKKRMTYYDSFLPDVCPYFESSTMRYEVHNFLNINLK